MRIRAVGKGSDNLTLVQPTLVYTATSVPCDWAAAVMRKPLANTEKANAGPTARQTD